MSSVVQRDVHTEPGCMEQLGIAAFQECVSAGDCRHLQGDARGGVGVLPLKRIQSLLALHLHVPLDLLLYRPLHGAQ